MPAHQIGGPYPAPVSADNSATAVRKIAARERRFKKAAAKGVGMKIPESASLSVPCYLASDWSRMRRVMTDFRHRNHLPSPDSVAWNASTS